MLDSLDWPTASRLMQLCLIWDIPGHPEVAAVWQNLAPDAPVVDFDAEVVSELQCRRDGLPGTELADEMAR
jgi:hypothetical protein